ncbi:MAG: SPOR domain-containing protein [Thiohalomonadaceae bacterium]
MADNKHDDEDLMSDFRDLFDEPDTAKAETPIDAQKASADLDELDAYLDDFSGDLERLDADDPADISTQMTEDESPQDVDAVAEPLTQAIAQDDTVLAEEPSLSEPMPEEDELFADALIHPELDEGEDALPSPTLNTEELDLSLGQSETENAGTAAALPERDETDAAPNALAAAALTAAATGSAHAAAASAGHVAPPGVGGPAQPSPDQGNSRLLRLSLVLSVLAGLVAVLALALSLGQRVAVDEAPASGLGMASDSLAIERLRMDISVLATRVNELAMIIEGPMSHLRQSSEDGLEAIEQRLARLEAAQQPGRADTAASAPSLVAPVNGTARLVSAPPGNTTAEPEVVTPLPSSTEASRSGGWSINLISLSSEKDARTEMARLRQMGIRVEMQEAQRDGRTWFRLQVPGFDSREGARAYIATIQQQTGINNAWVTRD